MRRGLPKWTEGAVRLSTLTQRYAEHAGGYRGHAPSGIATYTLTYQQFIAFLLNHGGTDDLRHFTIQNVEAFASYMSKAGLHPNTVFNRLGHLSSLAKFAMLQRGERGKPLMLNNPVEHVERPQKIRPNKKLLHLQEAALVAQTAALPNESIARDVWMDTALRASELCRLNVGDVSRDETGRAVIGVTVKGKGRQQERIQIQLGEEATSKLADWFLSRRIPSADESLLLNQAGERYTRSALYRVFERLGKRAGVTRIVVNPHSIRHLWNTVARGQGVDQETRAKLLNHADTRTLQEYEHVMPHETAVARDRVRAALRGISERSDSGSQASASFADFLHRSQPGESTRT